MPIFKYQDDKLNKFWEISITKKFFTYTVDYGQSGKSARRQSKSFPTIEEAKTFYETLVKRKLKKGYVEIDSLSESKKNRSEIFVASPKLEIKEKPQPEKREKLNIVRSINLNPEDYLWATWKPRNPLPKPEIRPFDRDYLISHVTKIGQPYVDWEKADIPIFMSEEEAYFWLAIICDESAYQFRRATEKSTSLVTKIKERSFGQKKSLEKTIQDLILLIQSTGLRNKITPKIALVFNCLFGIAESLIEVERLFSLNEDELLDYAVTVFQNVSAYKEMIASALGKTDKNQWSVERSQRNLRGHVHSCVSYTLPSALILGFKQYLRPYLDDNKARHIRQKLIPVLNLQQPYHQRINPLLHLASYVGMHSQISEVVQKWDSLVSAYSLRSSQYIELLLGLDSPQLILDELRRLQIYLNDEETIRAYLATTGLNHLDWIFLGFIKAGTRGYQAKNARKLLNFLVSIVQAPELAPYMLELISIESKFSSLAIDWLENNPDNAIAGLIPVVAKTDYQPIKTTQSQLKQEAIQFLCKMIKKGYKPLIEQAIKLESEEVANLIKSEVMENKELNYEPLNDRNTPQWLQKRVNGIKQKQISYNRLFSVTPADVDPIIIGKYCFNELQMNACLVALRKSTLDSPHPFLKEIKDNCDRSSINSFVWSLFERWSVQGKPKKEKWPVLALGLLGDDEIAIRLTPYIRKWPGQGQEHTAVSGLQCLRAIGSDTALMQINGIARKSRYRRLKVSAEECLQSIADDRKLSPEELEDRIIPSLGLDEKGKRVFDFGDRAAPLRDRQFHFALSPDLEAMVRDEEGQLKADLPEPAQKDNQELAHQAISDWKLLKKQIREVIKVQTIRLEQGMITQRRWKWEDFENLLVKHPFMIHLVRRIIWAGYDGENNLIRTFRVTEDYTYADAQDEEITPENIVKVGVIHPVNLSPKDKAAWGETLSDYEIIPPFAQIDRDVYTVTSEEANEIEIKRFQDIQIEGVTLGRMMKNSGWQRGFLDDSGRFEAHCKYFPHADITAITGKYEHQHVEISYSGGHEVIDGCLFVVGQIKRIKEYPAPNSWYAEKHYFKDKYIRLKDVDLVVMSEVLRNLYIVTAKRSNKN